MKKIIRTTEEKLMREYNEEMHPCHHDFEGDDLYNIDESEVEEFDKWMQEQKEQVTKPIVNLIGQDGNIFNLIGLASKALKKSGQPDKAKEMTEKVFASDSYDAALNIISDYCEIN